MARQKALPHGLKSRAGAKCRRAMSVAPRLRANAVGAIAFRHRLRKIGAVPLLCGGEESTRVHRDDRFSQMNCSTFATVSSTIHTSGS
ncbi:hypothetical protein NVSP9465_03700 [Novosphingobium sp. CECT 9465]|nr:hypothetical protein NVSP9465_03700 [Novosphingobium sp. CECT 9465]